MSDEQLEKSPEGSPPAGFKRILVVDDEEDVATVLRYVIEDGGYDVVTATTVDGALAKIPEGGFAAAVLDFKLGAASALEIAQAIRSDPSAAALPIIIVSGLEERVVREHFTDYELFLSKGADLTTLMDKLAVLTGGSMGNQGERAH